MSLQAMIFLIVSMNVQPDLRGILIVGVLLIVDPHFMETLSQGNVIQIQTIVLMDTMAIH